MSEWLTAHLSELAEAPWPDDDPTPPDVREALERKWCLDFFVERAISIYEIDGRDGVDDLGECPCDLKYVIWGLMDRIADPTGTPRSVRELRDPE